MSDAILKALTGVFNPPIRFSDLKVGQPFQWVVTNDSARNGVCIKVKPITGDIRFSGSIQPDAWVPLQNEDAGRIYAANTSGSLDTRVIPL